jgi:phytoene/squalene synthetase
MLRDTFADVRAGYFNVPREVLEAHSIGPEDIHCDPYRAWVESRTRLARADLAAGRAYFARVESARHRLAGLGYIARFEWLIETLEREDFRLRPQYAERNSLATGLRLGLHLLPWVIHTRGRHSTWPPIATQHESTP